MKKILFIMGTFLLVSVGLSVYAATVEYSTTSPTSGNVTAMLTGLSADDVIINNGGSPTYTFTSNGSFTFEYSGTTSTGSTTATVTRINTNAPTVTKLGNGTVDYSIASGSSANLVFSHTIANTGAIQTTITSWASATPSYSRSGATLTITANSGTITWADDVSASVTDTAGNTASNLLLIDSYAEPVLTAQDMTTGNQQTGILTTDYCPLGDNSSSTTDGNCYATRTGSITGSKYSTETNTAYLFAYSRGITDAATIQKAAVTSLITRKQFAKMASLFAMNVLGQKPNTGTNCTFTDMKKETVEMKTSAILACQLGIMGIDKSGQPNTTFNPNGNLTRAQFGTILSRLLRGAANNLDAVDYYRNHFAALKTAGIMTKTDDPTMKEIRGNIMIMLMRAANQ